jgi:hypothetical protein
VSDVLADAGIGASFKVDGATAGWNKGFFLASADGAYRLNIKGATQFRWAGDFRNIPTGARERLGVGHREELRLRESPNQTLRSTATSSTEPHY